jgi:predicted enzyme related to lactoylglutathione lyase
MDSFPTGGALCGLLIGFFATKLFINLEAVYGNAARGFYAEPHLIALEADYDYANFVANHYGLVWFAAQNQHQRPPWRARSSCGANCAPPRNAALGGLHYMVKDMAFIAYSVRDIPRARDFYHDVMGLELGDSFGDHWVEFNVGNATFGIGNGTPLGYEPGASTGAAFEVEDVRAMRDRLKKSGVEVSDVHEFPACLTCFARDPEGNRFALHQKRAPAPDNAA